jgi:hypothetical protein
MSYVPQLNLTFKEVHIIRHELLRSQEKGGSAPGAEGQGIEADLLSQNEIKKQHL